MKQFRCADHSLGAVTLILGCSAKEPAEVRLRILAIDDFHGHIAADYKTLGGGSIGRADFLGAHVVAARAEAYHSMIVSAGDPIGASSLISVLFHDGPTIEAMNLMGILT